MIKTRISAIEFVENDFHGSVYQNGEEVRISVGDQDATIEFTSPDDFKNFCKFLEQILIDRSWNKNNLR